MNKMKIYFLRILLILSLHIFNQIVFSQNNLTGPYDIYITNHATSPVVFYFHPVGMVFNGNFQYDFRSAIPQTSCGENLFYYINGICYFDSAGSYYYHYYYWREHGDAIGLANEIRTSSFAVGHFSRGLYKLEIQTPSTLNVDSCLLEFDGYEQSDPPGDLYIDYYDTDFTYGFQNKNQITVHINYSDKDHYTIKSWNPSGPGQFIPHYDRFKIYGPLSNNGYFDYYPPTNSSNYIPLDSRRDCSNVNLNVCTTWTNNNQVYPWDYVWPPFNDDDERVGELTLNLYIHGDVQTRINNWLYPNTSLYPYLPPITVDSGAIMKLASGNKIDLVEITNSNYSDFFMTIKSYAFLILGQTSIINVNPRNHLVFECNSYLICPNSGTPPYNQY